MTIIHTLTLEGIRNLNPTKLTFHPKLNLIHGINGSGKTALLEALFILGRGRSFRTGQTRHIIRHEQTYYRLVADIEQNGTQHLLGIERSNKHYRFHIDNGTIHPKI